MMVVLQAKEIQQSSRNIFLKATSREAVSKWTINPLQETKKQHMETSKQKRVRLANN